MSSYFISQHPIIVINISERYFLYKGNGAWVHVVLCWQNVTEQGLSLLGQELKEREKDRD